MSSPHKKRPNKNLGQHFLTDQNIIQKITSDHAEAANYIVEVGPGPGALTQHLCQKDKKLLLIEKDQRFKGSLLQFAAAENIVFTDALKYPLEDILQVQTGCWMVSNLPYNISSQLFIKFLQHIEIKFMTLMFQKEVGIKTADTEQKRSSLNCLSHNYFDSSVLCKVPPGAFSPPPKVNSIVISYTRKEDPRIPLSDFDVYQRFLRKLFEFKRKKMISILKKAYASYDWLQILEKFEIDDNIRAEALDHQSIQNLFLETM